MCKLWPISLWQEEDEVWPGLGEKCILLHLCQLVHASHLCKRRKFCGQASPPSRKENLPSVAIGTSAGGSVRLLSKVWRGQGSEGWVWLREAVSFQGSNPLVSSLGSSGSPHRPAP